MTTTFALLGDSGASAEYPESSLSEHTNSETETFTGEVAQPLRKKPVTMSKRVSIVEVTTSKIRFTDNGVGFLAFDVSVWDGIGCGWRAERGGFPFA